MTVQSYAAHGPLSIEGLVREPNPNYVQAAMLTQIKYPTGGSHRFYYEPNTIPETYLVPNPPIRVTANVAVQDGNAAGKRGKTFFRVLYPVEAHCSYYGSTDKTLYAFSSASVSLTDTTTHQNIPLPYSSGASFGQPNQSVVLQVGHVYQLTAFARGTGSSSITVSYTATTQTYANHNVVVGGLRLRAQYIRASRRDSATIKRYYYGLADRPSSSSGYLVNVVAPRYAREHISRVMGQGSPNLTGNNPQGSLIDITYTAVSSSTLGELEGTDQVVGYRNVTVVDSAADGQVNGRTVSEYSTAEESGTNMKPYPAKVLASWNRGNLLRQQQYAVQSNGHFALVTKVINRYAAMPAAEIRGFKSMPDASFDGGTLYSANYPVLPFSYINTYQPSNWPYLAQNQHFIYAFGGDTSSYQLITTRYEYTNPRHQQPTLTATSLSRGQWQQVHARYAADFDTAQVTASSSMGALAIRELLRAHAVAQPIEQITTRTTTTDTIITQGSITLFEKLAPKIIVPVSQWALHLATPLPWATFRASSLQRGALAIYSNYEPKLYLDRYDAQRHLIQAHAVGDTPISYLWDMAAEQPIAKANAAIRQLAFTSFESNAPGRWLFASQYVTTGISRTGMRAYRLSGHRSVSRDSIPAGNYELLVWVQGASIPQLALVGGVVSKPMQVITTGGGGWHQYRAQLRFSGLGAVSVMTETGQSILLDDLVLKPTGTQLSSYTYDVLRGMTSQTDASGRTTFFEYDGLGRLLRTRDEQGRVLSQQQYHYAKP